MKKIAALFTLVLSFGVNFAGAQQQNGPTPGQVIGAFGALVDLANGNNHPQPPQGGHNNNGWNNGGHNNPGQYPGHNNPPPPPGGHYNGQPGYNPGYNPGHNPGYNPNPGYPGVPNVPNPQPWHPQPGPGYGQFQKMNSIGSYSTPSDAEAAKNVAVRALTDMRFTVMEARVEYNSGYRFVITYNAPQPVTVSKYQGGSYSTPSEARQAAEQTAAALKARGEKVILETPVYYNSGYTYTVGYVNLYPYQDQDEQQQTYNSVGSYSTPGEATAAREAAVAVLKGFEITVLEARTMYNSGYRFVITYVCSEAMPLEQYKGGAYSTPSAAREAANQTAATLKANGKVVLETPVYYNSGYTYTVAYVTIYQNHHQSDQLQTMNSVGAYSTPSEANAAKDAAAAALGQMRVTVLESRVEYNSGYRFVITYTSRRPLNVEQYNGGTYPTPSSARQAADQTVAAMRAQGNIVVLETPVFYNSGYTYSVTYVTRRW